MEMNPVKTTQKRTEFLCQKRTLTTCWLFLLSLCSIAQDVKFNNNYSVACHNCYEKKLATDFQDVFTYTHTIELDIWNENFGIGLLARLLGKDLRGDWYVKHRPQERGNKNFTNGSLRNCLMHLKAWSDANPAHQVITVFIDKKQDWGDELLGKKPADLDKLILSVFSKADIFLPVDLLGNQQNLKAAARCNWPVLDSLKGKFVFVLTDGTIFSFRKPLNDYQKSQGKEAVCFIAPRISSEAEIQQPKGLSADLASNVVFYNLKDAHSNLAETINGIDCISRVYGSSKTENYDRYEAMVGQKVNFVALYNYKIPYEYGVKVKSL